MKVHYLQHVPYEGIGSIAEWARTRGHELSGSLLWTRPEEATGTDHSAPSFADFPSPDSLDLLVVMGGPMNVYEDAEYPWLPAEKELIRACIARGKAVLGICLGAQLIAAAMGGEVTRAPYEEIGWYPVDLTEEGRRLAVFAHLPARFTTLQWHGDTFTIPDGAVHAASSEAVPNQVFTLDDGRVVGLQFHLEETRQSLSELVGAAGDYLPAGRPWVAPPESLLAPRCPVRSLPGATLRTAGQDGHAASQGGAHTVIKRIDTENHFASEAWVDALRKNSGYPRLVAESSGQSTLHPAPGTHLTYRVLDRLLDLDEGRIALLDEAGLDIAVLSLAAPGTEPFEPIAGDQDRPGDQRRFGDRHRPAPGPLSGLCDSRPQRRRRRGGGAREVRQGARLSRLEHALELR